MTSTRWWRVLLLAMVVFSITLEATAWGPQAKQVIMNTSLQLLRREYSERYFDGMEFKFTKDLLQGALDGPTDVLDVQWQTRADVLNTVKTEINLLREVRKYGVGSYFAYRLGVIGGLVADCCLPYSLGIDEGPQSAELRERVNVDTDEHLQSFRFGWNDRQLQFVETVADYLAETKTYSPEAKDMIAVDYAHGAGYDGYLKNGADVFYTRACIAVADIWHTVLRLEGGIFETLPSDRAIAWYFADEIEYLLLSKGNVPDAERAYDHFVSADPGIPEAYERIGDHYYRFGDMGRAVDEWRIAASISSPIRQRVVEKLSDHFISVGKEKLAQGTAPRPPEGALQDAVEAFREALGVDRANEEAAQLLAEAQFAKKEREALQQAMIEIIASAEQILAQAERAADAGLYEQAISTYEKAKNLCRGVGDDFPDQEKQARDLAADADSSIAGILNRVLETAQDNIDKARALAEENLFDEALGQYATIPGILSVIPDDPTTGHGQTKEKLVEQAEKETEDTKMRQRRYEEEQERKRQMAESGGGEGTSGEGTGAAAPAPSTGGGGGGFL